MLYYSDIDHKPIFTVQGQLVGHLDDLIFSFEKTPRIKKFFITKGKSRFFDIKRLMDEEDKIVVPIFYLEKLKGKRIIIKDDYQETHTEENELFIKKNLLDTQVIDIEDNNIVRVNDVLIKDESPKDFSIDGVDIGLMGILRWFGLDKHFDNFFHSLRQSAPQYILPWSDIQPLELTRGRVVIKSRFNSLKTLHPADVADYLETQNFRNALTLIEGIDKEYVAEVISELNPSYQLSLLRRMPTEKIAYIVSLLDSDDAVDILSVLNKKKQETILASLGEKSANQIRKLLNFNTTPLGEYLNSDVVTVYHDERVSSVLKKIKENTSNFSLLHYVYVVNKEDQIIGVFSLHELLLSSLDTPVYKFMTSRLITASLTTPVEVAYRRMVKYKLETLPVIDESKKILGIISDDDIAEVVIRQYAE